VTDLKWTRSATSELARLHRSLAPLNATAAARAVQALTAAPSRLLIQPRMGRRLEEFDPREVRGILVGHYEMRYEIQGDKLLVLRIWHAREDR
jgi:plasmid stabilization system protein ParE